MHKFLLSAIIAAVVASTAVASPVRSAIGSRQDENIGPLPYDAEIEYLAGDGTPYINTGIRLRSTDTVTIGLYIDTDDKTTWFGIFGSRDDTRFLIMRVYANRTDYVNFFGPNKDVYFNRFEWGEFTHVFGGEYHESTEDCFLFRYNNRGGLSPSTRYLISKFTIVRDGRRILDLIPVRFTNELGETEGGMYDKISGEILTNRWNGSFEIGPDL